MSGQHVLRGGSLRHAAGPQPARRTATSSRPAPAGRSPACASPPTSTCPPAASRPRSPEAGHRRRAPRSGRLVVAPGRRDPARARASPQPWIPPVWFYDELGSALFDEITRLPEYYPTRAERSILDARSPARSRRSAVPTRSSSSARARRRRRCSCSTPSPDGPAGLERFVPFDVSEAPLRPRRPTSRRPSGPTSRSTPSSATSTATSARCHAAGGGWWRSSAAPSATSIPRPAAGSSPTSAPMLEADECVPPRHRPREGPSPARRRLRRRRRRHRRRSTATPSSCSTASWAPTSTPTRSSTAPHWDEDDSWIEMHLVATHRPGRHRRRPRRPRGPLRRPASTSAPRSAPSSRPDGIAAELVGRRSRHRPPVDRRRRRLPPHPRRARGD